MLRLGFRALVIAYAVFSTLLTLEFMREFSEVRAQNEWLQARISTLESLWGMDGRYGYWNGERE